MGHLGLEPRTIRLKAEYSTIELVTLFSFLSIQKNNLVYYKKLFFLSTFKIKIVGDDNVLGN